MNTELIRNFSIIAHIDHGKSTLADRMLELTQSITGKMKYSKQMLDDMDLEQERGITIKAHAVRMDYIAKDGNKYILNLIDTPGHVDFSYEVSRSLAACEGALIVVDATQGIEAQTISNLYLALEHDLNIIPVINKIDLPSANVEDVSDSLCELLGIEKSEIIPISAKMGINVDKVLERIITEIPPPKGDKTAPFRGMIFDSVFDTYRGAVPYVRVVDGEISKGDWIEFFANDKTYEVDEIGYLRLKKVPCEKLSAGEVGYIIANIRRVADTKVGDTITLASNPADKPLPGFKDIKPMVFSGIYPTDAEEYEQLRDALDKLKLNDASLIYTPETSAALGFGFRCGFLGLLHMEIIQERLSREFEMSIINTVPNVEYRVTTDGAEPEMISNPVKMPPAGRGVVIEEPFVRANIISPPDFIGNIMKISMDRRGVYRTTEYLSTERALLQFDFPLSEIIFDFYDKLKTMTRGYGSLDYDYIGYRQSDLVRLDLLINGDPVDALCNIVHRDKAHDYGKRVNSKLRELIPRQMFEVVIQSAIGNKIVSREVVKPLRKNVTAKCYGGDITRKRKLLERQREGKRRMKTVGKIDIPQEAFLAVLKIDET
ncbi:MAG: elongation factor 4 [candidate division Zixibacteria bacterium]|nr:elongation factor 4 [candidate division Zixibacteria bacterium]